MRRIFVFGATLAATAMPTTLVAQASPPQSAGVVAQSGQRHFVVLHKRGPNFADHAQYRDKMVQHRQIYLDLVASGDIIASGLLSTDPPTGFILFGAQVDEGHIKSILQADFSVQSKIVDLEFLYWTIQMGKLPVSGSTEK
jgi:hypothetical protein